MERRVNRIRRVKKGTQEGKWRKKTFWKPTCVVGCLKILSSLSVPQNPIPPLILLTSMDLLWILQTTPSELSSLNSSLHPASNSSSHPLLKHRSCLPKYQLCYLPIFSNCAHTSMSQSHLYLCSKIPAAAFPALLLPYPMDQANLSLSFLAL